jgi:hypothetical protein
MLPHINTPFKIVDTDNITGAGKRQPFQLRVMIYINCGWHYSESERAESFVSQQSVLLDLTSASLQFLEQHCRHAGGYTCSDKFIPHLFGWRQYAADKICTVGGSGGGEAMIIIGEVVVGTVNLIPHKETRCFVWWRSVRPASDASAPWC